MITVDDLITRAQGAVGQKIKYKLGSGGMNPQAALPSNIYRELDCSGYVCWCLGVSRKTEHPLYVKFNGGWINTDAIVRDAKLSTGFFSRLVTPRPGCLIVFPASAPKSSVGHVGIVTRVDRGGKNVTRVLHCSSGNSAKGDAVRETPPSVFNNAQTIYAWYEGIV